MTDPHVILVTGATGFIGSALRQTLRARFPHATVRGLSLTGGEGVEQVDLAREADLARHVVGADWVFHLAAFTRVPDILEDPSRGFAVNVGGTARVLDACRAAGTPRCVVLSTGRVLGSPAELPAHEDLPVAPAEPYGAQKAAAEVLARAYHQAYNQDIIIIRPAIVYGPGRVMTPGSLSGVVPRFAQLMLAGDPVTLVGDGEQRSDFVYVDDVVAGLIAAAEQGRSGHTYHFGSGRGTSIRELIDVMAEAAGVVPNITRLPASSETVDLFLSRDKAARELGYGPDVSLADGLRSYIEWLRQVEGTHA